MSKVAPFGSWKSPITSELYASAYVGLSEVQVEDGTVYWNELRPKEQGRYVVVQLQTDGKTIEITPPGFSTRTRVHEYGGGSYLVDKGTVFFSNPRISPDGRKLAYLTWNHPNMPWDGTELWIGTFDADGKLANSQRVAGGLRESVYQPEWSPDNRLYFVSDRTGWWNLYRSNNGHAEPVCPLEAELGVSPSFEKCHSRQSLPFNPKTCGVSDNERAHSPLVLLSGEDP